MNNSIHITTSALMPLWSSL